MNYVRHISYLAQIQTFHQSILPQSLLYCSVGGREEGDGSGAGEKAG